MEKLTIIAVLGALLLAITNLLINPSLSPQHNQKEELE